MHENRITRFALMRHARTVWNEERRIQGWKDSPLTQEGREQARVWGCCLAERNFDRVLCSDLGRARETANLINKSLGVRITEDPRLRERNFGGLEGEHLSKWSGKSLLAEGELQDGEPVECVRERVLSSLTETGASGERILVVTHFGVMHGLLTHLAGPAYPFYYKGRKLIRSKRLHWVGAGQGSVGILQLNDRITP